MLDLSPGNFIIPLDFGKQAWSFGQIVPVLMLAAPLISIAETFKEREFYKTGFQRTCSKTRLSETDPSEETLVPRELSDGHLSSRLPLSSTGYSTSEDPERPDSGWASHSSCLGTATTYICVTCIYMGVSVFLSSSEGTAPLNSIRQLGVLIAVAIYYFYCVVLCSLVIELAVPPDLCWLRRFLQSLVIALYITSSFTFEASIWFLIFATGPYFIGAFIHKSIGWSKR